MFLVVLIILSTMLIHGIGCLCCDSTGGNDIGQALETALVVEVMMVVAVPAVAVTDFFVNERKCRRKYLLLLLYAKTIHYQRRYPTAFGYLFLFFVERWQGRNARLPCLVDRRGTW